MNREEVLNLVDEIIEKNPIAFMGTVNSNLFPNIKAMQTMKKEGINIFYFSTRSDSRKIKQIKGRKNGCIYYCDKENYQGVLIEGSFEIEKNTMFGISELYKLDAIDPFDFVTIKFKSKKLYVYTHYQTAEIDL